MQKQYYGPLWIMDKITTTGLGSGVALTTGQTSLETTEYYQAAAKGLIVSCPSANSGDMYLVLRYSDDTFKASNNGTVIAVIAKGTVFQLPQAEYGGNKYKLADLGIDGANNDIAYPVAIMQ